MGAWVAWVKSLRGLRGLRGSKYFLRGSTFYVGHNFYVGCVGQMFLRGSFCGSKYFSMGLCVVKIFCVGPKFVRGLFCFAWDSFYLLDDVILLHCN